MGVTISLVQGYSLTAHKAGCYTVRRAEGVHGIAELDESEVVAFLKGRRLVEPCGVCLKKYVVSA